MTDAEREIVQRALDVESFGAQEAFRELATPKFVWALMEATGDLKQVGWANQDDEMTTWEDHAAYADEVGTAGYRYQGACHDCDWRAEDVHEAKDAAREDAAEHRYANKNRPVFVVVPTTGEA
jgi:hypothetical protein